MPSRASRRRDSSRTSPPGALPLPTSNRGLIKATILPPIRDVLAPGGLVIALIKPQFEVGKGNAPGGLVRDEKLRLEARNGIVRFATDVLNLELLGLAESPIRGKEMGNVEYLSYWKKENES